MMGERDPQKQLWSYQVNLDKRVRSDHPLRRINETLELDFVRREVAQFYGTNGNVSEDPVVLMKMMLLLFLDNVRSERELMRIIPERLDYMWFLGYGLDDTVPNHSVLSKARKRWGEEVFVALFSRVVAQCVRAGLVEGTKIHADSSLVDANASLNSVRELDAATLDQIRRACREQTEKLEEADTKKNEADDDQYPNIPGPGPRTEINQKYQSNTDPEATLVRQHGFKTRPRYKNHRVVDDAHGVITAVHTTTGRINESHELMELVDQHQANTAIAAQTIVADCKYGTIENYIVCQKRKLRTHMADLLGSSPGSGRRDGIYPESMFRYQPESDTFLCPDGQLMKPRRLHSVRLTWEYVTKRGVCLKCHLRKFCTRSRTGRTMRRHRDQKLLDRARRQANTKQAKLDRKRRQHLIERSFADASNLHGFKRARWRGLIKQSIQDLLIAAVQNLRKLIAAMHYASENSYLALIDTLSSFLQAFTTLLTTDLPFLILDLPPVLLPSIPASTPISPVVRATDRGNGNLRTLGSTVSSWNRTRRHLMRNAEPLAQSSGSPVPAFP
jgi:transposase